MTRDEISALLPFLANGTLEGDERVEVEAALAGDAALQAELRALRAIRATMQAEESFSPGEMGLARLMRGVEAEAPVAAPAPAPAPSRPWLWQVAAAVLLAVVVGQAAWQFRGTPAPGGYELAGGGEAAFVIAVTPGASEEAFRDLLLQAGVTIVDGPSALGLYQLALTEGVTEEHARAILAASPLIDDLQSPED